MWRWAASIIVSKLVLWVLTLRSRLLCSFMFFEQCKKKNINKHQIKDVLCFKQHSICKASLIPVCIHPIHHWHLVAPVGHCHWNSFCLSYCKSHHTPPQPPIKSNHWNLSRVVELNWFYKQIKTQEGGQRHINTVYPKSGLWTFE